MAWYGMVCYSIVYYGMAGWSSSLRVSDLSTSLNVGAADSSSTTHTHTHTASSNTRLHSQAGKPLHVHTDARAHTHAALIHTRSTSHPPPPPPKHAHAHTPPRPCGNKREYLALQLHHIFTTQHKNLSWSRFIGDIKYLKWSSRSNRGVCKKKKKKNVVCPAWHTTPEPSRAEGRRKYYPGTWQPATLTQRTVGTEVCRAPLQTMSHRTTACHREAFRVPSATAAPVALQHRGQLRGLSGWRGITPLLLVTARVSFLERETLSDTLLIPPL